MSNKIRLIFLIVIFFIFIGSVVMFNDFQAPLNPELEKISEFKITQISGNGKLYFDKKAIPMESSEYSSVQPVDIKQMQYSGPLYLRADGQAAFEFYCLETVFTALPYSYLYFQPKTEGFYLYNGEFYWSRVAKERKSPVTINIREPQSTLVLSDSGRIIIREDLTLIWNYPGPGPGASSSVLTFNNGETDFNLNPNQLLILRSNKSPRVVDVLPLPGSIDPENKIITLKIPEDSVVRFNWKSVPGAKQYRFKLYSSRVRENTLIEKSTPLSWVNLDLLSYEEREFYWQVFPIDMNDGEPVEGVPSKLGHIQLVGALLVKKDVQKPPQLIIKSLTVNGNLVIIKGNADANSQLTINDEAVKVDMDGEFIHYLSFTSIGPKRIFFRLVSPLGVETTEERYVTIFAE
jgi:hypothetical protein